QDRERPHYPRPPVPRPLRGRERALALRVRGDRATGEQPGSHPPRPGAHGDPRAERGRCKVVTPLDLLAAVDDLPQSESGAIMVDAEGTIVGSVLAEDRRVCWAAAASNGRRLRDLLRRYSAITLTDLELERIFLACRTQGRPLGETLVERGLCSEEAMQAAL